MNSRREFINGAGAVALMSAVCPPSFAGSAQRRLRAGIVSDIHVRGPDWTLDPFIAALKWFDAQKVDVVAVAGDLTDFGLVEELRHVGKAWDDVFPGGRAGDGRAVEKVFVTGNHDNHFYNHAHVKKKYPDADERFARSIARDFDAAWRECFHEPFKPFSVKTVKGYRFVAANYAQKGLAAFIEKNKAEFADPSKPFFYVQHQHLRDTCHGPMAWGRDKGESTRALSAFPNAVAFSGHSHYPLTDERAIWQGSFTSIGTASLKYITPPEFCDYENGIKISEVATHDVDYKHFADAGFNLANCGDFGVFHTYLDTTSMPAPLDNIITTPNITIENAGVQTDEWMYDHVIIWADVTVR
ncbi:MAG: metallophosphoesterase [Clostridia bacterium]|nr:metallophosphoesterase [Clostridia bacterium]